MLFSTLVGNPGNSTFYSVLGRNLKRRPDDCIQGTGTRAIDGDLGHSDFGHATRQR